MSVGSLMRTVIKEVNRYGSSTLVDNQSIRTVERLQALGDESLNGLQVTSSYGQMRISRVGQNQTKTAVRNTTPQTLAQTNDDGVFTNVTSGGRLTIPQTLLRSIGIRRGSAYAYLRPINNQSFLVMRSRGTHPDTVRIGVYSDGRVVLSRGTVTSLMNVDVYDGDTFSVRANGSTANTLLVTLV